MSNHPGGPRILVVPTRKDVAHPPRLPKPKLTFLQRRAAELVGCLLGLAVTTLAHDVLEVEDEDCAPVVAERTAGEELPAPVYTDTNAPGFLAELSVPKAPAEWQKTTCDREAGEVAIAGACYLELAEKPPCGRGHYRHSEKCWAAVGKTHRPRTSIDR